MIVLKIHFVHITFLIWGIMLPLFLWSMTTDLIIFLRILWMVVLWVLKQQSLQLMSTMPTLITVGNICIIKKKLTWVFAFRRQVEKQNKMIKNQSGNNTKIISPWNYGHYGENAKYFKTLLYGYRDRFSRRWCFLRQTYDIRKFENSWFRWFFPLRGRKKCA